MKENVEDHLPHYRVRPRFKIKTTYTKEEIVEKMDTALNKEDAPCKGWVNIAGYGKLYMPQEEQHYWSPELSFSFSEMDEEKGCTLSGLYGPRPAVWTMFVFFYFAIGFAAVAISIIGLSNLSLNKSGSVLWLVPILILTFLTLYLVAYMGQRLGHQQMVTLHQFLEKSTGLVIQE
ncbi:MAG TPA: hypothetical protein ENJ53_06820 [Phaeodactylibacter sp.]|nr:hypothetical protein [Phaeodactylibacter sp.]